MNKQELQKRADALQAELNKLKEELAKPEVAPSLLLSEIKGEDRFCVSSVTTGGFQPISISSSYLKETDGNIFQSKELADNYAKAFNILLLLRHQPGTVAPIRNERQWVIRTEEGKSVLTGDYFTLSMKMSFISPCFKSKEEALNAIKVIGEANILHMLKTLHHVD